ncbi:hypothetical protein HPB52_023544 [Rhipicephalus sanguineus]|uniref:Uncharacterized protein n=1 Tax=Rhipicephalus sanguineus TaxID=34632 RepID=A0A9D4SRL8_RHISA|nr:hypothetical protein HPB52_023544 [Rhipicephalus sanguineus]
MAGHERGPRFKAPDEPRRKNSRVSVLDRARIVDVYRHGGDLKQLAEALGINMKTARQIKAALEGEMPGVTISTSTVARLLDAHSYSVKLVTQRPADRNRDDVKHSRLLVLSAWQLNSSARASASALASNRPYRQQRASSGFWRDSGSSPLPLDLRLRLVACS